MCPHRESGRLRAGQNAGRQMDHGGREERSNDPVFRDVGAYVSCRGYVGIPQGHRVIPMKQGGTADKLFYSSLTEEIILSRAIFYSPLTDTD